MDNVDTSRRSEDHNSAASINMTSPVASVFSRGHSSKSSASNLSLASSPVCPDSFDLYASRLGKVTEEQEKDEAEVDTLIGRSPSICRVFYTYQIILS